MARIFINYRRGDTSSNASRLCEWLGERYGEDQVFMDVDAIEPGLDWARAIENAVGSADLVLAMIGKDWLAELKRRSADEDDFMRYELETALSRDIRVIPVLVEGAKMPPTAELPESLASLTRRQAFEIRDERFRFDKEELFRRVDRALEGQGVAVPRTERAPQPNGSAAVAPVTPVEPAQPVGDDAAVENELKKWNWGAFLLGPIWGIGHGVWRSFLTFVPIYGLYEWVMLGLNGNRWAWEKRRYESPESFRKSQRKWAMWGAIVDSVLVLIVLGSSGG
ncbi:MAG TPA: toll/interleukin-1 receptor domain-containing protein [Gaiellaceae bacterium]|nr:toll/interleukin-1 receptor domain-containing protein [Gaiellaceae bacterium]